MSKTHPKPGKLKKKLSVTIGNQESAYRTLLSVPFLSKEDRKALMQAIVGGPELSWIRLAFKKGLLPARTAAQRTSTERFLAGSGAENAMLILRSEQRSQIRLRAIKRLTENPKSAYAALKAEYLDFTRQESILLLDAILPTLTGTQAYRLLGRHLWTYQPPLEVGTSRRLKLVEGLRKSEYAVVTAPQLLLHQGGTHSKRFSEPFTDAERKILVGLAIQHGGCACSLLFPSWEKENAQLSEDEHAVVVPVACEYFKSHLLDYRYPDKKKVAEAQQLLDQFGALLSEEQRQGLQATVREANAKAA